MEDIVLTEEEMQKVARAQAVGDAAKRVYDVIAAGLVIKETGWLSEQCVLLAANAIGMDETTAREALHLLKRSGAIFTPAGPDTLAPLRRTLQTV